MPSLAVSVRLHQFSDFRVGEAYLALKLGHDRSPGCLQALFQRDPQQLPGLLVHRKHLRNKGEGLAAKLERF